MSAALVKDRAPAEKRAGRVAQSVEAALIPDALLRIEVVETITGLGESTIRRKMAANDFPQSIRDGARCTRWRAADVTNWCRERAGAA